MASHNKGTQHYSVPDAARRAPRPGKPRGTPRFPNTTVDGELLDAFRRRCDARGITLAAGLAEALRAWLSEQA